MKSTRVICYILSLQTCGYKFTVSKSRSKSFGNPKFTVVGYSYLLQRGLKTRNFPKIYSDTYYCCIFFEWTSDVEIILSFCKCMNNTDYGNGTVPFNIFLVSPG